MERKYFPKPPSKCKNAKVMFGDDEENEIIADTHGFIKVYLGTDSVFKNYMDVAKGLDDFERNHPNETILNGLRK